MILFPLTWPTTRWIASDLHQKILGKNLDVLPVYYTYLY